MMMSQRVNTLTLENGVTVSWSECGDDLDCCILDEKWNMARATYVAGMTPHAILTVCVLCRQVTGTSLAEKVSKAVDVLTLDSRIIRGPIHVLF